MDRSPCTTQNGNMGSGAVGEERACPTRHPDPYVVRILLYVILTA
jgi:hypothetical protein